MPPDLPRQRRITVTWHERRLPAEALQAFLVTQGLQLDQPYAIVPNMAGDDVYVQTITAEPEEPAAPEEPAEPGETGP
jgi:hypothetical protein